MKIKPPSNIEPDVLFRKLLQTPRPMEKIDFTFSHAKDLSLYVKALTSNDFFECKRNEQIIQKCLYLSNNKPAFIDTNNLEFLTYREYQLLFNQIIEKLFSISPFFVIIDYDAWMDILIKGANHNLNYFTVHSLGQCFQYTNLATTLIIQDFPERYFSIPRNELLDGHWMAYLAAKKVYKMRNDL